MIADAIRAVAAGNEGRVLIIRGEPGIGKTALVKHAFRTASDRLDCRMFRCSRVDAELGFPSADQLGRSVREEQPRLVVVDDANWCHAEFRTALAKMARNIESERLFLVLVDRSELDQDWIRNISPLPSVQLVQPEPLTAEEVAALSDSYGRAEAAGEVFFQSGGNPMLASRLLSDPDRSELPAAVTDWTADRLRELDEATLRVAHAMAAFDEAGSLADVEYAAGQTTGDTLAAIDRLEAAALLTSIAPPRLGPPILVRAIRESIPAGEAIRLALAVARRLRDRDPIAAASQLISARPAGPSPEPWAIETIKAAVAAASSVGDTDQSIDLLRRLVQEDLADGDRLEALTTLGEMEAERRDPAAVEHLAEAATLAGDPLVRGRLALVRGRSLFHLIALEECSKVCREAIDDLPGSERELRLSLESAALDAEALLGVRRERPGELFDEVRSASTPGERLVLTHVLADQAASGAVPAAEIREAGRRILTNGDLLEEAGANSPTYIYLGTVLTWAGAYEEVIALTSEGIERGRREGSPAAVSYSAALRSGCALLIGDLDLAESDSALVVTELAGADPMSFAVALAWYLEVLVHRGRLEEARQFLESSGLTGELPELGTIDFLMLARGALLLAEGEVEKALVEFEEVGRRATRATYVNPAAMDWRSRAALAHLRVGNREQARLLAADELSLAESFGTKRSRGVALIASAAVEGGQPALDQLARSISLLAGISPVEQARARIAMGEELHRCGESRAREVLYEGLAQAQESGSLLLAERAIAGLRETGAKPRRRQLTGPDSLTRQERRIAGLAAEGRSNPEIAEEMFLTRRTVEMHLSNAYRKLEIKGRQELGQALQSSSP